MRTLTVSLSLPIACLLGLAACGPRVGHGPIGSRPGSVAVADDRAMFAAWLEEAKQGRSVAPVFMYGDVTDLLAPSVFGPFTSALDLDEALPGGVDPYGDRVRAAFPGRRLRVVAMYWVTAYEDGGGSDTTVALHLDGTTIVAVNITQME